MIVDHTQVEQDAAIRQIVALEADLFGHGAWSEHSVRQELNAPARTLGGARRQCAGIGII